MADEDGYPVYRIDREGRAGQVGVVVPCRDGGLPWWIEAMRPDGYLGRMAAARMARKFHRSNPREWEADQLLRVLDARFDDLPGDLVVGEYALRRFEETPPDPVAEAERVVAYKLLARRVLARIAPRAIVGGEQEKFTATVEGGGRLREVVVKFACPSSEAEGWDKGYWRRKADLLVCEHLALDVLREAGIAVAVSSIIQVDGWTFLESVRYDRHGKKGRSSSIPLYALILDYGLPLESWSSACRALHDEGVLSTEDLHLAWLLDLFGSMIANNDRHYGNLSLRLTDGTVFAPRRFSLAPVYDMLPAAYAWIYGDECLPKRQWFGKAAEGEDALYDAARRMASIFWRRVASDGRLSEEGLICTSDTHS